MNPEILVAMIGATVTILGWAVTNYFVKTGEDRTRRLEAVLERMERQIAEFYGPLFSLNEQMQNSWEVLETILNPESDGKGNPLSDSDRRQVEQYFREKYFFPIHDEIRELLKTKLFLIDGVKVPASFDKYLQHAIQERAQDEIWHRFQISTSYLHGKEYSDQFFKDVRAKFQAVMQDYNDALSERRQGTQRKRKR